MKICLFAHQKVVPITQRMHMLQCVWVKGQITMQDVRSTPGKHASRLSVLLTCRSPRTADDTRQHSGNVLRCADWGRPISWLFILDRAFFTPLPYPSTDWIWRRSFMSIHFMAKSALSLYSGSHPQHTHDLCLPNAPCRLISKVTALPETLVCHDTLAEKRVTEILKYSRTSIIRTNWDRR